MEITENDVTYSFEKTPNYNKFKYIRICNGKVIDETFVWVYGWEYDFLRLLNYWNARELDWKYVEVATW